MNSIFEEEKKHMKEKGRIMTELKYNTSLYDDCRSSECVLQCDNNA